MKRISLVVIAVVAFNSNAHASLSPASKKAAGNSSKVAELAVALSDFNKKCGSNALERFIGRLKRTVRPDSPNPVSQDEIEACRKARTVLNQKWRAFNITPPSYKASLPVIFANPEIYSQEKACAALPIGGGRIGLTTRHRVERVAERDYLVQVNLTFQATAGIDKSEEAKMREKVAGCYEYVGFMQDYNGYRLKLQLVDATKASELKVPHTKIQLFKGIRSNSMQYDVDLDCKAIVHEGLHLAGLDDEYREPGMECRAHADSIMSHHMDYEVTEGGFLRNHGEVTKNYGMPGATPVEYFVANRSSNPSFVRVEDVSCRIEGAYDERKLYQVGNEMKFLQRDGLSGIEATATFMDFFYVPVAETDDTQTLAQRPYLSKLLNVKSSHDSWKCETTPVAGAVQGPLVQAMGKRLYPLRPAHVRRVVYPSCQKINQLVQLCSVENYATTTPGQVCKKDQYAACQNEKWLD